MLHWEHITTCLLAGIVFHICFMELDSFLLVTDTLNCLFYLYESACLVFFLFIPVCIPHLIGPVHGSLTKC